MVAVWVGARLAPAALSPGRPPSQACAPLSTWQKPAFVFDGRNVAPLEELKRIGFQVYGIGQSLGSSTA